ncbi:MAG: hypothetical protein M1371_09690 [Actinobacteria bacterium]|nr:hypothetical protein [Actinomycetota bacterium]
MTGKQRMIKAFRNEGEPDRIPVSPDTSNVYPAKYTGKPFWDVFYFKNPPLWSAYLDLASRFEFDVCLEAPGLIGLEADIPGGSLSINTDGNVPATNKIADSNEENLIVEYIYHTKKGNLNKTLIFPLRKSPWCSKPLVENPEDDFEKIQALLVDPWSKDAREFKKIHQRVGEKGVVGPRIQMPTSWWFFLRGDASQAIMDYYDRPVIMESIMNAYSEYALEEVHACCHLLGADEIVFGGGNASLSIISPSMFSKFNLPFLENATQICKQHHVISHLHVCGLSRIIVEMVAGTDLNVMEPLERPPSGDIDLGEIKEKYGRKLCLKGNVNTFETLAQKDKDEVIRECLKCIINAGEGGGFVLSSGDQVPLETHEDNFIAMIKAAKIYGKYPLNISALCKELKNLDK